MKRTGTMAWLLCMLFVTAVQAQPVRNGVDVIWAKDVAGATMTLDGVLDEAVWQQAEMIEFVWNGDHPLPGSGQFTDGEFTPAEPTDPPSGTAYILRDGNTLWIGVEAQDKSIGGGGLWGVDGIVMNILDRARIDREAITIDSQPVTFNANGRDEFIITWWHDTNQGDTTDASSTYASGELIGSGRIMPGLPPRMHGFYGQPTNITATEDVRHDTLKAVWNSAYTVNGTALDDTHGDDEGYVIETRIDVSALGYDFTQAGGDKVALGIGLRDTDYGWPLDADEQYRSVVYWQNPWAGDYPEGVGYVYGAPDVTVGSGTAPAVTEPEFTVKNGELFNDPVIDGSLDDPVWAGVEPMLYLQYQADRELLDMNPTVAQHHIAWWRPDINSDGNAALVVDPSVGALRMFYKDNTLYVGLDVDDQAVSGFADEGGRDGMYLFLRGRDTTTTRGSLFAYNLEFSVDSTGAIRYGRDAAFLNAANPEALQGAVAMKGSSTPADPTDIDQGYQIEIAIDLVEALGYAEDLGDRKIWTAMNFFDGDFLESQGDSYATRTWTLTERGGGLGANIYGYLDPNAIIGTAAERPSELPAGIVLDGNYPNPFNPSTTLRYALSAAGDVSVQVFDVLGREVAQFAAGVQAAGRNTFTLNAAQLASGMYVYRIQVKDAVSGGINATAVGQMVLIK